MRTHNLGQRLFSPKHIFAIVMLSLAIISAYFGYQSLKQPQPEIFFETISDTNVIDLNRSLQDLSIDFRGQDIHEHNLNLKIMTINVVNSGEVDILTNHYDHEDDWGIKFKDAEVIEARLIDANSDYLKAKIIPRRLSTDTVVFPKVIFERGKSFAIEVLLLHSNNTAPSISPIGKIAGIDTIGVLTRSLTREEVNFINQVLNGSIPVHIVRSLIYQAAFIAIFFVFVLGLSLCFGDRDVISSDRKIRILKTQSIAGINEEHVRNYVITRYESSGIDGLRNLQIIIKTLDVPSRQVSDAEMLSLGYSNALNDLTNLGVLKKSEGEIVIVSPAFGDILDNLIAELED